jgi:hypothetical protein
MKKDTPDLMGGIAPKRKPGRPRKKPTPTTEQIAASLEAEGKKLINAARILRGRGKK